MILDFTLEIREPSSWPHDVIVAFEEAMCENAELKAKRGEHYWFRYETDGDLWDVSREYETLEGLALSYGPVVLPDRPLLDGFGDPALVKALIDQFAYPVTSVRAAS